MDPLNREVLRAELVRDEGERLRVYKCSEGFDTIGCGRNLQTVGLSEAEQVYLGCTVADVKRKGITKAQSAYLLDNDIDRSIADLDRALPWWRQLDPVRQRVLVNMCFNMGIGYSRKGLLSFSNTLNLIKTGQYAKAASNMLLSKWAKQVGARANRLAELMKLGIRKL
jgi:lysozyme